VEGQGSLICCLQIHTRELSQGSGQIFPCIKRFEGRPEEFKSDVDFLVNASERRSNPMVYIHFDSGYFLNCCIFDVFSNNHILDSHNNMDNTSNKRYHC
jgi:hypothetical protein